MIVIGAGMAGLLAARLFRQSGRELTIYEAQDRLPNNHSAVLRFRGTAISDATGIPFRRVRMIKAAHGHAGSAVADALAYSRKCTGRLFSDRSLPLMPVAEDRYIAPPDFIPQLAKGTNFLFGCDFFESEFWEVRAAHVPIISTIPMPALMRALGYPGAPTFSSVPSIHVRSRVADCDAYVSVYDADPESAVARASITGDEVIVEAPMPGASWEDLRRIVSDADAIARLLGRGAALLGLRDADLSADTRADAALYGKILPIPDDMRKDFIYWATEQHNIYSLGRYATWRPALMCDDLAQDVRLIGKWVAAGRFAARVHAARPLAQRLPPPIGQGDQRALAEG